MGTHHPRVEDIHYRPSRVAPRSDYVIADGRETAITGFLLHGGYFITCIDQFVDFVLTYQVALLAIRNLRFRLQLPAYLANCITREASPLKRFQRWSHSSLTLGHLYIYLPGSINFVLEESTVSLHVAPFVSRIPHFHHNAILGSDDSLSFLNIYNLKETVDGYVQNK
jgi:hypothetical protein